MKRIMLAVAILGSLTACGSDTMGNGYGARDSCHDFVKQQLKSPSSAKFTDLTATPTDSIGGPADIGPWTFTGTVDSQNDFGAMLRADWTCQVHRSGGDSTTTNFEGNAQVTPEQ